MVSYALDDNSIAQARDIHYKILDFVDPLFSEEILLELKDVEVTEYL
jgi:hypothetical protein